MSVQLFWIDWLDLQQLIYRVDEQKNTSSRLSVEVW